MKNKSLLFAFLICAYALPACQNTNRTGSDPDSLNKKTVDSAQSAMADTAGISDAPGAATFMEKAAIGGMLEVELGKIAQKQGSDSRVKDFGALMVKDHGKANDELKSIAAVKNVTLPTTFPAKEQAHIDEMKKMSGKDFDKHYIDMMVNDHVKDIELFKTATNSPDTAVNKFANKVLPIIQGHHQKAEDISKNLN